MVEVERYAGHIESFSVHNLKHFKELEVKKNGV